MSDRDLPSVLMRVTANGLVPVDELGVEELFRYPVGTEVEITVFREPSPPLRRLYFAVLEQVYPSTDYPSKDALATDIKVRLRHVDGYITLANGAKITPRSLSDFSHEELEQFVEAAFALIQTEIIPGVDLTPVIDGARTKQTRRRR